MNHLFFLKLSTELTRLMVGFATLAATAGFVPSQSAETVLYRFKGGTDGFIPIPGENDWEGIPESAGI